MPTRQHKQHVHATTRRSEHHGTTSTPRRRAVNTRRDGRASDPSQPRPQAGVPRVALGSTPSGDTRQLLPREATLSLDRPARSGSQSPPAAAAPGGSGSLGLAARPLLVARNRSTRAAEARHSLQHIAALSICVPAHLPFATSETTCAARGGGGRIVLVSLQGAKRSRRDMRRGPKAGPSDRRGRVSGVLFSTCRLA